MNQSGWRLALKRILDRVAGTIGFVLLLPVMLAVAVAIRVAMGSPILFRQQRPGFREQLFVIYKFRTMRDATGADGRPLPDEARVTRVGNAIRGWSLDELPQLWNVVRGELSLVGPRPLLVEYLDRYTDEQRSRHDVLPGITGWAQIHGRNAISWDEKFALDRWYVRNWSLRLDFQILAMTIAQVLKGKDTTHPGHASMPVFTGSSRTDSDAKEEARPGVDRGV